jgi:ribonuclease HII
VGIVSEKIIDKINILEATKLAMKKSLAKINPDFLILDGNFSAQGGPASGWKIPEKSIIKGDAKVFSIAAASIIAKVTRDRLMQKYHKKYPEYGFNQHKGYGTKAHFASLEKFGYCKIHRKTFWPINSYPQA